MSADQFLTLDGRPTVRVERRYPHPIDKVWRAVTTPEHLGQWFPSPVELDLRPGGTMRFSGLGGRAGSGRHGRGRRCPATAHVHVGHRPADVRARAGRRRHDVRADPLVRRPLRRAELRHRLGAVPRRPAQRARRRAAAAARPRHRPARGAGPRVRPRPARGDRVRLARWTVRVERQLTCPAEVAWDLWFGKDRDTGEQRSAPAVGEPLTPYMAPEVVIGTMTEVELHRVLAFDVAPTGGPGDHVRVELADGTGHGARITSRSPAPTPASATRPPRCGARGPSGTSPHRPPSGRRRNLWRPDQAATASSAACRRAAAHRTHLALQHRYTSAAPSAGRSATSEGFGGLAVELVANDGLRSDHPGIVAGLDHSTRHRADLDLGPVVVASRHHVANRATVAPRFPSRERHLRQIAPRALSYMASTWGMICSFSCFRSSSVFATGTPWNGGQRSGIVNPASL